MKLHVDLESLQLIEGPGFRNPVTALRFKRGDAANLEVTFLRNGTTPEAIGDPAAMELRFGIKPRNRFDVGYLVHTDAWTLPAVDAQTPIYQCAPSFNTTELNSSLNVGSTTATELSEITLMGEITWREGSGEPTSTRTFAVIVENDVNRGDEGVPTDAEPAYPAPGLIPTTADITAAIDAYDTSNAPPTTTLPYLRINGTWYPATHSGTPTNSPDNTFGGTPGWLGRLAIGGGNAWICLQNNLTAANSGWRMIETFSMDPQITPVTFDSYETLISFGVVHAGRTYRLRIDSFSSIPELDEVFGITFVASGLAALINITQETSAHLSASLDTDASLLMQVATGDEPASPQDMYAEILFTALSSFEWTGYSSNGVYGSGFTNSATITITPL